jgi:hypothetical protein
MEEVLAAAGALAAMPSRRATPGYATTKEEAPMRFRPSVMLTAFAFAVMLAACGQSSDKAAADVKAAAEAAAQAKAAAETSAQATKAAADKAADAAKAAASDAAAKASESSASKAADATKEAADKAAQATKEAADKAAAAAKEAAAKDDEEVADARGWRSDGAPRDAALRSHEHASRVTRIAAAFAASRRGSFLMRVNSGPAKEHAMKNDRVLTV